MALANGAKACTNSRKTDWAYQVLERKPWTARPVTLRRMDTRQAEMGLSNR